MRDYCLDCTIKHLGQAYVLHSEVESGYPKHLIAVIGHLAEASEECIGASKELSDEIRQYRLLLLENLIPIMKEEKKVSIPYFDLFEKCLSFYIINFKNLFDYTKKSPAPKGYQTIFCSLLRDAPCGPCPPQLAASASEGGGGETRTHESRKGLRFSRPLQ